jgi:hypothetical protein
MTAAIGLRRQRAKCVGTPPGRGLRCPPAIQVRRITGRSTRRPARPSPGPEACCRARGARTIRDLHFAPTEQTDCAGKRQSAHCAREASPSSGARFVERSTCGDSKSERNSRQATAPTPPAARSSRTGAEARYTKAVANTCANIPGTGSAELQWDCATRRQRCDRPCGDSSRVATARPIGSADTHPVDRPRGSCPELPNDHRWW